MRYDDLQIIDPGNKIGFIDWIRKTYRLCNAFNLFRIFVIAIIHIDQATI